MSVGPALGRVDRRRFLRLAAGGCALPGLLSLSACAAGRTYTGRLEGRRIRIPTADLAGAFGDEDALMVRAEGLSDAVYLVRADGQVTGAVGATCTHLGCQVRPANRFFLCPCHGSTYTLEGQVVRGPAPRPLPRYELTVTEDFLEIELP